MLLSPTFANPPSSPASVAPSSESASACGFHSGFRAGVGMGYKNHNIQNKYQYTAIQPLLIAGGIGETQQRTSVRQSALYQAHAAYDWIKNNWILSVEFDYRYNPTVNKSRITPNDIFLRTEPGDFVFEQSHRHDFGLGFRVGRIITSRFSLYGIANIRLGKFQYKFTNEKSLALPLQGGQRNQFRWGGGLGVGCQYALAKGFSIGPEITYDIYQPIKINQNLTEDPTLTTLFVQSSRPKIFNAVIKISKTF